MSKQFEKGDMVPHKLLLNNGYHKKIDVLDRNVHPRKRYVVYENEKENILLTIVSKTRLISFKHDLKDYYSKLAIADLEFTIKKLDNGTSILESNPYMKSDMYVIKTLIHKKIEFGIGIDKSQYTIKHCKDRLQVTFKEPGDQAQFLFLAHNSRSIKNSKQK